MVFLFSFFCGEVGVVIYWVVVSIRPFFLFTPNLVEMESNSTSDGLVQPPASWADSWRDFCLFEIGPIWNDVLSGQLTLSHRIPGAGTLTYIQLICMVNVGKQTIHGFYG